MEQIVCERGEIFILDFLSTQHVCMENNGMVDTTKKTDDENVGVHELFQIAMKVERNASDFYKKAANLYDNARVPTFYVLIWPSIKQCVI